MKKMIQIVYVSRSTTKPTATTQGIEPGIARILAKSRVNNRRVGLVGVLYFGDGCFFQCIEGDEGAIDTLYSKLESDPRHKDLKLISRKQIDQTSFGEWSMKYILSESKIQALLTEEGLTSFDPYRFSAAGTSKMLEILHESNDPGGTEIASLDVKHKNKARRAETAEEQQSPTPNRPKWMMIAGGAAVLVGVVAAAFYAVH